MAKIVFKDFPEATTRMINDFEEEIKRMEKIQKVAETHFKELKNDPFYEEILFKNNKEEYEEHVREFEEIVEKGRVYISELKNRADVTWLYFLPFVKITYTIMQPINIF